MNTTVSVVTSGDYSDQRVEYVFSDEELANKFANAKGGTSHSWYVQTFDLVTELEIPITYYTLRTGFDNQNSGYSDTIREEIIFPNMECFKPYKVKSGMWGHAAYKGRKTISLAVEGTDLEAIKKVSSEKKAMILAEFDVIWEKLRNQPQGMKEEIE